VVTGALLLALSLVLTARSWRFLRIPRSIENDLAPREGISRLGKAPA
jgi:hypothetical protein